MTITFDELIDKVKDDIIRGYDFCHIREDLMEMLIQVREATLKEAAEKAEAIEGWNIGFSGNASSVDKESILNLDKNSIEI